MYKPLFLLLTSLLCLPFYGQEGEDIPFALLDQRPRCQEIDPDTGRVEADFKQCLDRWVMRNLKFPEKAVLEKIEGRVLVLLRIDEQGNLSVLDVKGRAPVLQEEARRLFQGFPKVMPALQRGQPVATRFHYPIVFRLLD